MLSIRRELSKPKKESAQMELPEQKEAVEAPREAVLEEEPEVAEQDNLGVHFDHTLCNRIHAVCLQTQQREGDVYPPL